MAAAVLVPEVRVRDSTALVPDKKISAEADIKYSALIGAENTTLCKNLSKGSL